MVVTKLEPANALSTHPAPSDARWNDTHRDVLMTELEASLAREGVMIRAMEELLERQTLLKQEFEHRLVNGLQVVVSMLSMQSRAARSPEAALQLKDAAIRVAAISRVHHRLHLLDHEEEVDFRSYIEGLCVDLSALFFQDNVKRKLLVSGSDGRLPVAIGIPMGFIVSELVTNSAKYTDGDIDVYVADDGAVHSVTVTHEGSGLPDGFDPAHNKGLGMNIVRSLVKQIGGTLQFGPGKDGKGTSVVVSFASRR